MIHSPSWAFNSVLLYVVWWWFFFLVEKNDFHMEINFGISPWHVPHLLSFPLFPFIIFVFFDSWILDTPRVDSNANLKKEEVSNDGQLSMDVKNLNLKDDSNNSGKSAKPFTFDELAAATGNFRSDCCLGEGGFGKVYKGCLEKIEQVS